MAEDEEQQPPEVEGCYNACEHSYGQCMGWCGAWVPCCWCATPYKIVQQGKVGLVQRFGRYHRSVNPGLNYVNIQTEQMQQVSLRTKAIKIDPQTLVSKDNTRIVCTATILYRIKNPYKAIMEVDDIDQVVSNKAAQVIKNIIGNFQLQELLEQRDRINDEIEQECREDCPKWGIVISEVLIQDLMLTPDFARDIAVAAMEKRSAEAKVISAQADIEAANLMQKAASSLNIGPAMQIRYFETIQRIVDYNGNFKTLFLPFNQGS